MPLDQDALVLLDGQLVDMVVEADTGAGYVVQLQGEDVDAPQQRAGCVDVFHPSSRAEKLGLPPDATHHRDCPNAEKQA